LSIFASAPGNTKDIWHVKNLQQQSSKLFLWKPGLKWINYWKAFQLNKNQCAFNLAHRHTTPDQSYSCDAAKQTLCHTVNDCPQLRYPWR